MSAQNISHFMTYAQLEAYLEKLNKQIEVQKELIKLSTELFKELYVCKPHSPLVQRWHETIRKLIGS